ncbi:MAG: hypothetical protein AAF561_12605 [Planctomycetota bacterium]
MAASDRVRRHAFAEPTQPTSTGLRDDTVTIAKMMAFAFAMKSVSITSAYFSPLLWPFVTNASGPAETTVAIGSLIAGFFATVGIVFLLGARLLLSILTITTLPRAS